MVRVRMLLGTLLVVAGTASAEEGRWARTLEEVSGSVLSIQMDRTVSFDTTARGNSQATGFVVDAERGLVLTNRHVVSPGPILAVGRFQDDLEVPLVPIYRDPVHDFGVFRFDTSRVDADHLQSLELRPDEARVGLEIRVVGNDAGEKLAFLGGTLARLDRQAPNYGRGSYNDFNTFYYQASSATSGGSSGSPVISEAGHVVALNAGGNSRSAASFYLPLQRVERALDLLREGREVTRGSLQTTFVAQTLEDSRKLGLSDATRRRLADAGGHVLAVQSVLREGVGWGHLQEGDLLVAVDGRVITDFVTLESILDDAVGRTLQVELERAGALVTEQVRVEDLFAITPSAFAQLEDGVYHNLSYQLARSYNLPLGGVYVAMGGYGGKRSGIPGGSVIVEMAGRPIATVDDLVQVWAEQPRGAQVQVRYYLVSSPHQVRVAVWPVDGDWFHDRVCTLGEETWPCQDVQPNLERESQPVASTSWRDDGPRGLKLVRRSQVGVEVDLPVTYDGVSGASYMGMGLVVDADEGLVVADRNTAPLLLGDVWLTFARDLQVPAEVVANHPLHNLTLLRYDPALVGDTPVRSADLVDHMPEVDDRLRYFGFSEDGREMFEAVTVDQVGPSGAVTGYRGRFVDRTTPVIDVKPEPARGMGVLADKRGRVHALWGTFYTQAGRQESEVPGGIPAWVISEFVQQWREGREVPLLGAVFAPIPLTEARRLGLQDAQVAALAAADERRIALQVRTVDSALVEADLLHVGDVVVKVDGHTVTRPVEVQRALSTRGATTFELLRHGELRQVRVTPEAADLYGTSTLLQWQGAVLQATPYQLRMLHGLPTGQVYVDSVTGGSPARRAGLSPTSRVLAVNEQPVDSLETFLALAAQVEDGTYMRLLVEDVRGRKQVLTLRPDRHYWPGAWFTFGAEEGWRREPTERGELSSTSSASGVQAPAQGM